MSPLSGVVLGAAAVVASPAFLSVADGSMPLDVALTRYLIAVGICWALLSLVAEFAFPTPGAKPARAEAGTDPAPAPAESAPGEAA